MKDKELLKEFEDFEDFKDCSDDDDLISFVSIEDLLNDEINGFTVEAELLNSLFSDDEF